jgi:iron complex outermembrane receptor protein
VQDYIDAQRCSGCGHVGVRSANLTATTGFVNLQFANQSARLYGV